MFCNRKPWIGIVLGLGLLPLGSHAQECLSNVERSSPTSRFTLHDDGTATDNRTGLVWKRCNEGESWNVLTRACEGRFATYTWEQALVHVKALNTGGGGYVAPGGVKIWRLPNVKELRSIIEVTCVGPSVNLEVFPTTSGHYQLYWSSSPATENGETAWATYLSDLPTNAVTAEENGQFKAVWDRKDTREKINEKFAIRLVQD